MSLQGIFPKLDWYTCIFQNVSILEVLSLFGHSFSPDIEEAFASHYLSSKGYSSDLTFNFETLNIKADIMSLYEVQKGRPLEDFTADEFFSLPLPKLRLDISGSGLDFLRTLGFVPEDFFTHPFNLKEGQSFHTTRADFAFDFIDYQPEFLNNLINTLNSYQSDNGVPCMRCCAPIKYSLRTGDQKTVYLGSSRSDKVLRIYDKNLQYFQNPTHEHPYIDDDGCVPTSWIRFELQTRNDISSNCLFQMRTMFDVLRFAYDSFSIRDRETNSIASEWVNLFDWTSIESVIQNAKSVTYIDSLEKSERFISQQAFLSIITFVNAYGFQALRSKVLDLLDSCQKGTAPSDFYRYRAILHRLDNFSNLHPEFLPHIKFNGSKLVYSEFEYKNMKKPLEF